MVKARIQSRTTISVPCFFWLVSEKRPIQFHLSLSIHTTALSAFVFSPSLDHVPFYLSDSSPSLVPPKLQKENIDLSCPTILRFWVLLEEPLDLEPVKCPNKRIVPSGFLGAYIEIVLQQDREYYGFHLGD